MEWEEEMKQQIVLLMNQAETALLLGVLLGQLVHHINKIAIHKPGSQQQRLIQ